MENASKALLIAAGVLFTIIILSAVMLVYNGIANSQRELENSKITAQFSKINDQIEALTTSKTIYGSELLSLCNLLEDYAKKYPQSEGYSAINMTINLGIGIPGWPEMQGNKSYDNLINIYREKEKDVNIDEYQHSLITTFKNKKFSCEQVLYDNNTYIINFIKYKMK